MRLRSGDYLQETEGRLQDRDWLKGKSIGGECCSGLTSLNIQRGGLRMRNLPSPVIRAERRRLHQGA
jgi:hypothetical protein